MASNAEKREQVLWQMVSYLEGVVDASVADRDAVVRVGGSMGDFYAQLNELENDEVGCDA